MNNHEFIFSKPLKSNLEWSVGVGYVGRTYYLEQISEDYRFYGLVPMPRGTQWGFSGNIGIRKIWKAFYYGCVVKNQFNYFGKKFTVYDDVYYSKEVKALQYELQLFLDLGFSLTVSGRLGFEFGIETGMRRIGLINPNRIPWPDQFFHNHHKWIWDPAIFPYWRLIWRFDKKS